MWILSTLCMIALIAGVFVREMRRTPYLQRCTIISLRGGRLGIVMQMNRCTASVLRSDGRAMRIALSEIERDGQLWRERRWWDARTNI